MISGPAGDNDDDDETSLWSVVVARSARRWKFRLDAFTATRTFGLSYVRRLFFRSRDKWKRLLTIVYTQLRYRRWQCRSYGPRWRKNPHRRCPCGQPNFRTADNFVGSKHEKVGQYLQRYNSDQREFPKWKRIKISPGKNGIDRERRRNCRALVTRSHRNGTVSGEVRSGKLPPKALGGTWRKHLRRSLIRGRARVYAPQFPSDRFQFSQGDEGRKFRARGCTRSQRRLNGQLTREPVLPNAEQTLVLLPALVRPRHRRRRLFRGDAARAGRLTNRAAGIRKSSSRGRGKVGRRRKQISLAPRLTVPSSLPAPSANTPTTPGVALHSSPRRGTRAERGDSRGTGNSVGSVASASSRLLDLSRPLEW